MKSKIVMAIETSCDETAVSVLEGFYDENLLLYQWICHSHVIESQASKHAIFGGVIPEVAARDHLSKIQTITELALTQAEKNMSEIDELAVTLGPGLIGALMVGVLFARGLSLAYNVPIKGIHHIDAHLFPALLVPEFSVQNHLKKKLNVSSIKFPALALTVSGGHCHLSLLTTKQQGNNEFEKFILGRSLDDACGEAFDKISKLLGLGYPGGPSIEKQAKKFETLFPKKINQKIHNGKNILDFSITLNNKEMPYAFSYSGLKTSVLHYIRKLLGNPLGKISGAGLSEEHKMEICYYFQEAALHQLRDRCSLALKSHPETQCLYIAGGVAQNLRFRELFSSFQIPVQFAPVALCSDNATMIGLAALYGNLQRNAMVEHCFSHHN